MCQQHSTVIYHTQDGGFRIDPCMREEIADIRSTGVTTLACCCGHGKYRKTVIIKIHDINVEYYTGILIPRKTRFYKRDKDGIFYIPEVEALGKPKP
jgi:hypothetical protein